MMQETDIITSIATNRYTDVNNQLPTWRKYAYDGLGNWDSVETKTSGTVTTEARTDTSFNEYANVGGLPQWHDENGNLTSDSLRVFAWDGFNRLREVRTTTDSLIASYCYDAGNRRMQKDVGPSAPAGQDTDFFYSAWQLLEERNVDTSGTLRYSFVWGNYIDEPLARDDGASGRLFYHQNTLFSTCAVSDEAGDIQERYAYDPYGKVTFFDDTGTVLTASTLSVHHLFTGRELDPETGFQLNRNRYYDAERGRWVRQDPTTISDKVSMENNKKELHFANLYIYCDNRPITQLDPNGNLPWAKFKSCCIDTGNLEEEIRRYRFAAVRVHGRKYGSRSARKIGCGYCADEIMAEILTVPTISKTYQCILPRKISAHRIGKEWVHQFVAFKLNIDRIRKWGALQNHSSPVFDGWDKDSDKMKECHFSEGTVGYYKKRWPNERWLKPW